MPQISARRAGLILGIAAGIGVAADLLLRATPWGLNVLLVVSLVVAAAAVLARQAAGLALVPIPIMFAGFLAWRDAPGLQFANTLAMLTGLGLLALRARGVQLALAGTVAYARGAMTEVVHIVVGVPLLVMSDVPWATLLTGWRTRQTSAALVGAVLAIPLLLVFAPLLMAADPVFDALVRSLFDWDFGSMASHAALTGFAAWVVAGYLRGVVSPLDVAVPRAALPQRPRLGMVEIGVALGALALIFTAFVAIQIRYLFGGEELVLATTGLTYAEYARQGFFELVAVAALVVPVLLASAWLLDRESPRNARRFRALAAVILGLVAVIMESALARMRLYVDAYGLTADRFYATAFMVWIGVVLAWFAWTVLFGDERRFAFGAVLTGLGVLAVLNLVNPHARIAAANLARAEQGQSLDVAYLGRLSADAVPRVSRALPFLPPVDRCALVERLGRWSGRNQGDWRSWNLGRWRARRAVEQVRERVQCAPS